MTEAFRSLDTIDEILAAARREGLELLERDARLDTSGLDFVVVHARDANGTPWIVRSPRRRDVVDAARREARVLAAVAGALAPVAVPSWRVHADDVIAYPRIAGTPAVTVADGVPTWHVIDPAAPCDVFVTSCATMLAALQAADAVEVQVTTIDDERAALARTFDVVRPVLQPSDAIWARWQRWLDDDATWPAHVTHVHGDLHPGHLVLESDGQLAGVLDWTEARVTDPSVDFAMFQVCFGRGALDALITAFAAAGGRTWPRMTEHAIERAASFAALGAEWALRTGNHTALEFARAQLAQL